VLIATLHLDLVTLNERFLYMFFATLIIPDTADLQGFSIILYLSLGFTENGQKTRKYPVSGSSVGENALLMPEVRGEWLD